MIDPISNVCLIHPIIDCKSYFRVTFRTDVPLAVVYDFVNDRLRAVRQDMIIQRLPPRECQVLLEPMVRFYVYFGYRYINCVQFIHLFTDIHLHPYSTHLMVIKSVMAMQSQFVLNFLTFSGFANIQ